MYVHYVFNKTKENRALEFNTCTFRIRIGHEHQPHEIKSRSWEFIRCLIKCEFNVTFTNQLLLYF